MDEQFGLEEKSSFDLQAEISKYLKKWPWFLIMPSGLRTIPH